MTKKRSLSKETELLNIVQHKTPAHEVTKEVVRQDTESEESIKALIYFRPEDRQRIRELAAFFASQGLRINDSLVIKSVLRAVRPGPDLLAAYHEAVQFDRRRKKPQGQ